MKYNVLVVGAGPAGVSAAYFIKQYDKNDLIDVDLVERLNWGKYQQFHDMCGEAISKNLIDELAPLKPQGILEKIKLIREHWPGEIIIDTKMAGYMIDRTAFFKSIIGEFERLGGKFKNKSVKNISQKNNKIKIKFEDKLKEYDYVIASDGANSIIRKKLDIDGRTRIFIQYIVDAEPNHGILEFFYDEKYNGDYKWIFPHENQTKIGYPLIPGRKFEPKAKILKKQSRAIGYGGVKKYVDNKVLLVGDAACQTNPITKGGIRAGMIAGKLAAKAIVNNNPSKYEEEWLKNDFSSNIFNESFEKLKKMDNKMLEEHIKPFMNVDLQNTYQRTILYLKLLLFYRKYTKLYKAYELSNRAGW